MANQTMAAVKAAVKAEKPIVSKFSDALGARLVVQSRQLKDGRCEVVARHTKAGAKRADVGMVTLFSPNEKPKATARFNELQALAKSAGWTPDQPKAKKVTGFVVMPAAAVKKVA